MREYHKINSIFKRDPASNMKTFLMGEFALPEFEYLQNNPWVFEEKIDGTNVRVGWDGMKVDFGGRTDNAQMPVPLVKRVQDLFTPKSLAECFGVDPDCSDVVLYGEGCGKGIQKGGGIYCPDGVDFILFDVVVDGMYLERHNVADIAQKLNIRTAPIVGTGTLAQAVEWCQKPFDSVVGKGPAEGLVLRPTVELSDRRGNRIITKVKVRDFR